MNHELSQEIIKKLKLKTNRWTSCSHIDTPNGWTWEEKDEYGYVELNIEGRGKIPLRVVMSTPNEKSEISDLSELCGMSTRGDVTKVESKTFRSEIIYVADMKDLDFSNTEFYYCTFVNFNFEDCDLSNCYFSGCVFEGNNDTDGEFRNCDLRHTSFGGCHFSKVNFVNCLTYDVHQDGDENYFGDCKFYNADFSSFVVEGEDLEFVHCCLSQKDVIQVHTCNGNLSSHKGYTYVNGETVSGDLSEEVLKLIQS